MKMKPLKEIIDKLLYSMFMKDFIQGNCCASDQIQWCINDGVTMKKLYHEWLIRNQFANP